MELSRFKIFNPIFYEIQMEVHKRRPENFVLRFWSILLSLSCYMQHCGVNSLLSIYLRAPLFCQRQTTHPLHVTYNTDIPLMSQNRMSPNGFAIDFYQKNFRNRLSHSKTLLRKHKTKPRKTEHLRKL